jgi:hypothetical protein
MNEAVKKYSDYATLSNQAIVYYTSEQEGTSTQE